MDNAFSAPWRFLESVSALFVDDGVEFVCNGSNSRAIVDARGKPAGSTGVVLLDG
jgi:hypothetical protein